MKIEVEKLPFPASIVHAVVREVGLIIDTRLVGGGCIAQSMCIATDQGQFFLKWGDADVSRTFAAEAEGLHELGLTSSGLIVPAVVAHCDNQSGFLLLQWVEPGQPNPNTWERFGRELAALHRYTQHEYGFRSDNYIGRLPQNNAWHPSWPTFFQTRRLEPQVARSRALGVWQAGWDVLLEGLYKRLHQLLPENPEPSIVHGDLWSGNYMVTLQGEVALIDPATYYGHREVDLAMSELFGGFDDRFYEAYQEAWPLTSGYKDRRDVYNLYHLINHLNHFGASYRRSIERILKLYGS